VSGSGREISQPVADHLGEDGEGGVEVDGIPVSRDPQGEAVDGRDNEAGKGAQAGGGLGVGLSAGSRGCGFVEPELEHSLFKVHGLPIAPEAVVNEVGDTMIVTCAAGDARAEALVRALAVASRNVVWVADHALPWGDLRDVVVCGAVGLARRVGEALRLARESGQDAAAAVAAAAAGRVVFRGRVESFDSEERDGFTWGDLELAGEAADAGSSYRIWSKNENLLAWRDGAPDVTAPDLICCLSGGSGDPVTNPHHVEDTLVDVVGVPAAPQWRTPAGVAVLGPRHFGFDIDFVPLEERLAFGSR
jgi:DUF917 family protein